MRRPLSEYGGEIARTGESLHRLGDQLRRVGVSPVADALESGAGYARRYGSYLQNSDVGSLARDLDTLARQQPTLVIVGGAVVGFAVARLLKMDRRP
ncbi:MAG: hypothetical protein ACREMP_00105 [Candidatus Tyrphobacter sp.]